MEIVLCHFPLSTRLAENDTMQGRQGLMTRTLWPSAHLSRRCPSLGKAPRQVVFWGAFYADCWGCLLQSGGRRRELAGVGRLENRALAALLSTAASRWPAPQAGPSTDRFPDLLAQRSEAQTLGTPESGDDKLVKCVSFSGRNKIPRRTLSLFNKTRREPFFGPAWMENPGKLERSADWAG